MRHLLLAAPLAVLLSACAEPCDAPMLTASWTFTLADGSRGVGCYGAGVSTVNLWIDGVSAGQGIDCAQGSVSVPGLDAGDHDFTIQGVSASGAVRYQTWGTTSVDSCGERRVLLEPGAGTLRVNYATSTGLCYAEADAAQTLGYVWFNLVDRTTGLSAALVNSAVTPALLPCRTGTSAQVNIPVPWGLYRLAWMQVVTYPVSSTPAAIYQTCPPTDPAGGGYLDTAVVLSGVTALPVTLAAVTAGSPTCP